jgi:hypothetical protein
MKCIKKDKEIVRVSDKKAVSLVNSGWDYCPKEEWKKATRKKPSEKTPKAKKSKKD